MGLLRIKFSDIGGPLKSGLLEWLKMHPPNPFTVLLDAHIFGVP